MRCGVPAWIVPRYRTALREQKKGADKQRLLSPVARSNRLASFRFAHRNEPREAHQRDRCRRGDRRTNEYGYE